MSDKDNTAPPDAEETPQERRRDLRLGMLSHWDTLMDQIIEEAQAAGAFDNLPGAGKPLNLEDNPYAGDKQLAYKLLKDNNYTLPWIADRNQLLADVDHFRAVLSETWRRFAVEWRGSRDTGQAPLQRRRWQHQLDDWTEEIGRLNKRVHELNLQLPVKRLEIIPLHLDDELRRLNIPQELA